MSLKDTMYRFCRRYAVDAKVEIKKTDLKISWQASYYPLGLEKLRSVLVKNLYRQCEIESGVNFLKFKNIMDKQQFEMTLLQLNALPIHLK